jgi:hypothetical protein
VRLHPARQLCVFDREKASGAVALEQLDRRFIARKNQIQIAVEIEVGERRAGCELVVIGQFLRSFDERAGAVVQEKLRMIAA